MIRKLLWLLQIDSKHYAYKTFYLSASVRFSESGWYFQAPVLGVVLNRIIGSFLNSLALQGERLI